MIEGLLPKHNAARSLVEWIEDSPDGPLPLGLRARLRWGAFWFERLLRMQRSQLVPLKPCPAPSFVMGFWRSGTTLLHNLLYSDFTCETSLTWQCNAPGSFVLQDSPRQNASAQRPMDEGVVHLFGPQEDEFALLLLGEPSLYRGLLDPTRLDSLAEECLPCSSVPPPRWIEFLASLSSGTQPLLLKSPNHVFRLNVIVQSWPSSRVVWICRPFAEVLASNLRMWRMMMDLHRLRPSEVDVVPFLERVARRYRDIVAGLLGGTTLPMLWIDHADLVAKPEIVSAQAAIFLSLKPRLTPLSGFTDPVVHPSKTSPTPALPNIELEALAREIDELHAVALAEWGCRI